MRQAHFATVIQQQLPSPSPLQLPPPATPGPHTASTATSASHSQLLQHCNLETQAHSRRSEAPASASSPQLLLLRGLNATEQAAYLLQELAAALAVHRAPGHQMYRALRLQGRTQAPLDTASNMHGY